MEVVKQRRKCLRSEGILSEYQLQKGQMVHLPSVKQHNSHLREEGREGLEERKAEAQHYESMLSTEQDKKAILEVQTSVPCGFMPVQNLQEPGASRMLGCTLPRSSIPRLHL